MQLLSLGSSRKWSVLGASVIVIFNFSYLTTAHAQVKGGEAGVVFGSLGELIEKFGAPAAIHAAKMLPKMIESNDSPTKERETILRASRQPNLQGPGFLLISADGVCRLYFLNDRNLAFTANPTSPSKKFESSSLSGRKVDVDRNSIFAANDTSQPENPASLT